MKLLIKFHLNTELDALVVSLFVMGFCVGPLLWGPLSEQASVDITLLLLAAANVWLHPVRTSTYLDRQLPWIHG